jgi:hypothetical protein
MAGKIIETCGCEYRREDSGRETTIKRCRQHEADAYLDAAEAAEYERLGDRGYWR